MKKFVFLAHGFRAVQLKWWTSIQDHVVDSRNPLFNGRMGLLTDCPMDTWVYEAMPM